MSDTLEVGTAELLPPPEPSSARARNVFDWMKRNLFRSPSDIVITLVATAAVVFVVFRLARFVLSTGRWEVVKVNLASFMVGRYPRDDLWRVVLVIAGFAAFGGLVAGIVAGRQRRAGAGETNWLRWLARLLLRIWPLIVGIAVVLSMTTTNGPWVSVVIIAAAFLLGRVAGQFVPGIPILPVVAVGVVGAVAAVWFLTRPAGWDSWGGMMLNVSLAIAGISLSFPLGVLLALGRRSKLPIVKTVSVIYIEFFRGVPLYVLLLMSLLTLGFFLPPSMSTPGLVVRAVVVFTLFTAAYIAEIVRGGLQSLPKGQTEAAVALGLSKLRVTKEIVLPQALRNVIPAIVGQFISLFKDTTLAGAAMGFFELFGIGDAVRSQPAFQGAGLYGEIAAFTMLLFWVGSITMSRESQRLERKLGVGR